ncbi:hypothetical protein RQM47_01615 [Rubrivirga sp. S365]|uniref:hypothetical protein n=1 Tax=Rubrivirga sp. S365 TaxID=3076080 RepID=UPI0028C7A595|nr:hypothetical protein [Rubrivirga sp. S365]MDT7855331.1 hypothetical protein [Rubrivirga sp. S365]
MRRYFLSNVGLAAPTRLMSSPSPVSTLSGVWLPMALFVLLGGCDGMDVYSGGGRIYAGGQSFGAAIALDGNVSMITASSSDEAFVLRRDGDRWASEAQLLPPSGVPDDERSGEGIVFGWAGDVEGSVAIVGAPVLGAAARSIPGRAYVFEHRGGDWVRTADLRASDPSLGRLFGRAVAVSKGRVAVAAGAATTLVSEDLVEPAAVILYERLGESWAEVSRVEETEYERPTGLGGGSFFGSGLALNGDRLAVGSPGQDVGGVRGVGAIRVYQWTGEAWALSDVLSPPALRENDEMGNVVALDGPVLAAGVSGRDVGGGIGGGSAFVFRNSGGGWTVEAELLPVGLTSRSIYGYSIAASGDRVAVGDVARAEDRGSVFVWVRRPSGEWEMEAELWPSGLGGGSAFGESVALEGDRLMVGAVGAGGAEGGAYEFQRGPDGWVQVGG